MTLQVTCACTAKGDYVVDKRCIYDTKRTHPQQKSETNLSSRGTGNGSNVRGP